MSLGRVYRHEHHLSFSDSCRELRQTVGPRRNTGDGGHTGGTMTRVLAVVPSLEDPVLTISSLRRQTLPPSEILSATGKFPGEQVGHRVSQAINLALKDVDLDRYDYLLRVDSDTVLPPTWIERSVATGADVVGRAGYALLVKMDAFLRVGGRYPVFHPEDSLLILRLRSLGFRCVDYPVQPVLLRKPGRGTDMRLGNYIRSGMQFRRLGYEPVHVLVSAIASSAARGNPRYLLSPAGYFFALLFRAAPFDPRLARFVFRLQVDGLRRDVARTGARRDQGGPVR